MRGVWADAVVGEELLGVPVVGDDEAHAAGPFDRAHDPAEARVGRLDRLHDRRNDSGVADHVGVREVDDDKAETAVVDCGHDLVGDLDSRHLRLEVVARDVARRGDEDPFLVVERLLAAAVEEVRHVRVLLRLGRVELADAVRAQHLGERPLDNVLGERDGEREAVAVARHRREVDAEFAELLRELAPAVGAEVEEDRGVGGGIEARPPLHDRRLDELVRHSGVVVPLHFHEGIAPLGG